MDDTEVIKQQMAETRDSLAGKIDALETKVMGTVQDATDAVASVKDSVEETVASVKDSVQDTVAAVRGTVSDTVDTVKDAFDVTAQVERRPWAMFAGAVAVGFLGGFLMGPSARRSRRDERWPDMDDGRSNWLPEWPRRGSAPLPQATHSEPAASPTPSKPGWLDEALERFQPAISKLKELAIGATTGMVGEMIMSNVPMHLRGDVSGVIDRFTTALGGKVTPLATASAQGDDSRPHSRFAQHEQGNGRGV